MTGQNEPITIAGALTIVLTTGIAFVAILWPGGLDAAIQIAAIAFGNALIGLGAIIYARARSTPNSAPVVQEGTKITVVTPPGTDNRVITA